MSALYSIVLLLSVARLETYLRETRIPDQQIIDLGMLTTWLVDVFNISSEKKLF